MGEGGRRVRRGRPAVTAGGWLDGRGRQKHKKENRIALEKPVVDPVDGPPPADLVVQDITVGDGDEAQPGQQVSVHYVGVAHSSGEEFDASWNRGAPFSFPLGGGRVVPGWDRGVAGMKVGGRGKLGIPPHLSYGGRRAGGGHTAGETPG